MEGSGHAAFQHGLVLQTELVSVHQGRRHSAGLGQAMNLSDVTQRHSLRPTGVLHIGAGMCEEAEEYAKMELPVLWVDALPHDDRRYDNAAKYQQRLYQNLALSDTEEDGTFRITNNLASSSLLPLSRHSALYPDVVVAKEVPVRTRRVDSVVMALPGNTLVLDTQGNELRVLKGMGQLLDGIEYAIVEVFLQPLYEGSTDRAEITQWLKERGFQAIEF